MFVKLHTDALFVISRILHNEFNIRVASESSNKRAIATFSYVPRLRSSRRNNTGNLLFQVCRIFFHNLIKRRGKAPNRLFRARPFAIQRWVNGSKNTFSRKSCQSFSTYRENFSRCRLVAGCYKVPPISDEILEIRQILPEGQFENS